MEYSEVRVWERGFRLKPNDAYWLLFSHSFMSDSLWPHGLQHTRLPCSSLSPRVCSDSCPLSWWCCSTNSYFVTLFSCPKSFPASRSFQMSQLFASGGRSIGVSASTSVLWPPHVKSWLTGKDPDAGRDWRQKEKGMTEDEMGGWHHWRDGHEFE